jgi:Myb-like DNA-binding domain
MHPNSSNELSISLSQEEEGEIGEEGEIVVVSTTTTTTTTPATTAAAAPLSRPQNHTAGGGAPIPSNFRRPMMDRGFSRRNFSHNTGRNSGSMGSGDNGGRHGLNTGRGRGWRGGRGGMHSNTVNSTTHGMTNTGNASTWDSSSSRNYNNNNNSNNNNSYTFANHRSHEPNIFPMASRIGGGEPISRSLSEGATTRNGLPISDIHRNIDPRHAASANIPPTIHHTDIQSSRSSGETSGIQSGIQSGIPPPPPPPPLPFRSNKKYRGPPPPPLRGPLSSDGRNNYTQQPSNNNYGWNGETTTSSSHSQRNMISERDGDYRSGDNSIGTHSNSIMGGSGHEDDVQGDLSASNNPSDTVSQNRRDGEIWGTSASVPMPFDVASIGDRGYYAASMDGQSRLNLPGRETSEYVRGDFGPSGTNTWSNTNERSYSSTSQDPQDHPSVLSQIDRQQSYYSFSSRDLESTRGEFGWSGNSGMVNTMERSLSGMSQEIDSTYSRGDRERRPNEYGSHRAPDTSGPGLDSFQPKGFQDSFFPRERTRPGDFSRGLPLSHGTEIGNIRRGSFHQTSLHQPVPARLTSSYSSLADIPRDFTMGSRTSFRSSPTPRLKSMSISSQPDRSVSLTENTFDHTKTVYDETANQMKNVDSTEPKLSDLTSSDAVLKFEKKSGLDSNALGDVPSSKDVREQPTTNSSLHDHPAHTTSGVIAQMRWDPRFPRPTESSQPAVSAPSVSHSKKPDPLTVSTLGLENIDKAESSIKQVSELMNDPSLMSEVRGETKLPEKLIIIRAIKKMEQSITHAQDQAEIAREELAQIEKGEALELGRRKEAELLEHQRRVAEKEEERKQLEEQKRKEVKLEIDKKIEKRREELQVKLEEHKQKCQKEREAMQLRFDERVKKAKADVRKRRKAQMVNDKVNGMDSLDAEIEKVERQVQRALKEVAAADAEQLRLQAELKHTEPPLEQTKAEVEVNPIANILAENRRKAQEAHKLPLALLEGENDELNQIVDPRDCRTIHDWSLLAHNVIGRVDALYTEPWNNPYFLQHQETHAQIGPIVKESVRLKKQKLMKRWTELAVEYVGRTELYEKEASRSGIRLGSLTENTMLHGRSSMLNMSNQAAVSSLPSPNTSIVGGRSSNNPYRRARRGAPSTGDIVRSEYEQEQIIAELTAKEMFEKRISQGGIPPTNQVVPLERELTVSYVNTFEAQRTLDPLKEAQEQSLTNIWTDTEKCIFLDRFLHHPKDFRKIASFLRNKSTRDCVAFYYNSKQSVPYKLALKEFLMRRKRRGDYQIWDATIEASLACGATVATGQNVGRPLIFTLPEEDLSFNTFDLHPIKSKIFDKVDISAAQIDDNAFEELISSKNRKRKQESTFKMEKKNVKVLKSATDETECTVKRDKQTLDDRNPTGRKPPQKWTSGEKKLFQEIVGEYGKNWSMLEEAIGNKTMAQIKNYYYDHKKQFSRQNATTADEKADAMETEKLRKKSMPPTDKESEIEDEILPNQSLGQEENIHKENVVEPIAQEAEVNPVLKLDVTAGRPPESAVDATRASQQDAMLLMQQQQNHFLQQHAAQQEEVRRRFQSHIGIPGISGLSPWASQLVALQQQQQQQQQQNARNLHHRHQHHSDAMVRDYFEAQTIHNALGLGQAHGFAIDPQAQLRSLLMYQSASPANATFLQNIESNAVQQTGTERLPGLGGPSDAMNFLRAAAAAGGGLASNPSPTSMAEALALLKSRARGYPQDPHDPRQNHY